MMLTAVIYCRSSIIHCFISYSMLGYIITQSIKMIKYKYKPKNWTKYLNKSKIDIKIKIKVKIGNYGNQEIKTGTKIKILRKTNNK